MAQLEIKGKDGKVVGKHDLGGALKEAKPNSALLHRAVVAEEANSRQGTQSAKTRSEVRGGGRKPYKQKKTGNARQGTIRAPHYAHGGMAFAVKPRSYEKKVNRKERRAAILSALAAKIEAGDVTVTENIVFTAPKTREATKFLAGLGVGNRSILVVLPQHDEITFKCFRNLAHVTVRTAPSPKAEEGKESKTNTFSARDLAIAHKVVIAQGALQLIEEVWY